MFFVLQTQLLEPVLIFFWGGGALNVEQMLTQDLF